MARDTLSGRSRGAVPERSRAPLKGTPHLLFPSRRWSQYQVRKGKSAELPGGSRAGKPGAVQTPSGSCWRKSHRSREWMGHLWSRP